jgi:hypothetical protein
MSACVSIDVRCVDACAQGGGYPSVIGDGTQHGYTHPTHSLTNKLHGYTPLTPPSP